MTNIEREEEITEAKRQSLASDLRELRDRLSGADVVTALARNFGLDIDSFRKSTQADEDKLPYALIGAGAAMLASRAWEDHRKGEDYAYDHNDYLSASDVGTARARLQRRAGESDDAYATRTYEEYGRRLDIHRHENEDEHAFMDRVDDAMNALSSRLRHGYDRTGRAANATGRGIAGAAGATGRGLRGAASATGSGIAGAASATGSGIKSAGSGVAQGADRVATSLSERAQRLNDHAHSLSRHAQDRAALAKREMSAKARQFNDAHKENPSVGLGVGMGLGMLAGSFTPVTDRERRATDPLASALMEAAQQALGRVNESIDRAEQDKPTTTH
jgi:type IV secretion system protein TrbL